jgi:hypothetical protein
VVAGAGGDEERPARGGGYARGSGGGGDRRRPVWAPGTSGGGGVGGATRTRTRCSPTCGALRRELGLTGTLSGRPDGASGALEGSLGRRKVSRRVRNLAEGR